MSRFCVPSAVMTEARSSAERSLEMNASIKHSSCIPRLKGSGEVSLAIMENRMQILLEARKALTAFTLYHRVQDGKDVRCMHCGNVWTGELHGHRRLYSSDPPEPPIHKEGCPVPAASRVIKSIDAALVTNGS